MNQYNDKWTREMFVEYRKLKRSGYTHQMLKDHFGEVIYESGLYNKNAHIIPYEYFNKLSENRLNEIKINPEYTDYNSVPEPSKYLKGKTDYIISIELNNTKYILTFMYFQINGMETYNVVFTTLDQWNEYNSKLLMFMKNGEITKEQHKELNDIIGRTTNLNDILPLFKKLSWVVMDFYNRVIKNKTLSVGETNDKRKIKFYRNIIKDSFTNVTESEVSDKDKNKYFVYKIN